MNFQKAAVTGAKWLVVSNIFQKVFTFAINQVIIRQSSPEIFGIAAVQLELLLSTLLFLSREGIRLALLRVVSTDILSKQHCINLSWIPALVVCICTMVLYCHCPDFIGGMSRDVVLLYCLGALFESVGEPWFSSYNRSLEFGPRVAADALAVTARSISTYAGVVYFNMGVRGFGYAQLIYGMTHCVVLMAHHRVVFGNSSRFSDFLPSSAQSSTIIGGNTDDTRVEAKQSFLRNSVDRVLGWSIAKNALSMTGTSMLKHLLTEADKITLSLTASHYDQGVYAVTHNYGSLVVRLFFMPLEETSRVAFSRMSVTGDERVTKRPGKNDACRSEMASMLRNVLKAVLLIGVLFPLFGPPYARLAVKVALGSKWYSDDTVLAISAFCFYIFVMGVNGVTEAFVQAVAVPGVWSAVNVSLLLSSGGFLLSAPLLIAQLGTSGIIVANTLSMLIRIASSMYFIMTYLDSPSITSKKHSHVLNSLLPGVVDIACMVVVVLGTHLSSLYFAKSDMTMTDSLRHVAVGVICVALFAGCMWKSHSDDLISIVKYLYTTKKRVD